MKKYRNNEASMTQVLILRNSIDHHYRYSYTKKNVFIMKRKY